MSCIDSMKRWALSLGLGLIVACTPTAPSAPAPPAATTITAPPTPPATSPSAAGSVANAKLAAATAAAAVRLPAPRVVRNWAEVREQAAERMVAANPTLTYAGEVPDPLLAIPVLEIELNADGSIRRIEVRRVPRQAKDTVQIAIDAVRKAAPYGDVSRLPKPWRFTETFLFDDDRHFKPRTLDR